MKEQDISPLAEASPKFNVNPVNFQLDLPMLEIILQSKADENIRVRSEHSTIGEH